MQKKGASKREIKTNMKKLRVWKFEIKEEPINLRTVVKIMINKYYVGKIKAIPKHCPFPLISREPNRKIEENIEITLLESTLKVETDTNLRFQPSALSSFLSFFLSAESKDRDQRHRVLMGNFKRLLWVFPPFPLLRESSSRITVCYPGFRTGPIR